jgi:phenylalanyl-tRNA synthetase alpha chain
MVHPDVLRGVNYDPDVLSGWAFGVGIERIAMVRHDIADIRAFYQNEAGFLEQMA